MDIARTLRQGDERELLKLWRLAHDRRTWAWVLDKGRERGNDEHVAVAERQLADLPPVTALQALEANRRLVELLSDRRWTAMQQAREEGASWERVGAALGVSRQSAWEWYRKQIEAQERHVGDLHDAPRARAALGDAIVDAVGAAVGGAVADMPGLAGGRDAAGQPIARDDYDAALWERLDGPAEGDRVRLTYGDGGTVEGVWEFAGGDGDAFALRRDDGTLHRHTTGQVRRDIVRRDVVGRADRARLPLLTEDEATVVADLLDELAAVYRAEPLGTTARAMSARLWDRLGR